MSCRSIKHSHLKIDFSVVCQPPAPVSGKHIRFFRCLPTSSTCVWKTYQILGVNPPRLIPFYRLYSILMESKSQLTFVQKIHRLFKTTDHAETRELFSSRIRSLVSGQIFGRLIPGHMHFFHQDPDDFLVLHMPHLSADAYHSGSKTFFPAFFSAFSTRRAL